MKKFIMLLAGTMFVLGATLCPANNLIPKQEKDATIGGIPKQRTIHLEKTDDKATKEMQKDIKALKGETKAPAAPEEKAVTAAPPAPADTKAQAAQPTKKDKKAAKKSKKTKKDPQPKN
jgi:hypothetical protein